MPAITDTFASSAARPSGFAKAGKSARGHPRDVWDLLEADNSCGRATCLQYDSRLDALGKALLTHL